MYTHTHTHTLAVFPQTQCLMGVTHFNVLIVQPKTPPDYTREMEVKQKGKTYCFAVGPLVDDGATRTFFVSCSESL